MIGKSLHHYRILRELGSGAMGQVYLAEDTRLGRKVALKLLPATLVADERRRKRFARESKALAALNHPNVVTIHSVEEADSQPFLVMEWVEGRSLEALIPSGGLPLHQLLDLAISIADGIDATHRAGIIHRDLKPSNIMVRIDGVVKLVDFGISKREEPTLADGVISQESELTTAVGHVVGTLPYMSPEQLEGRWVDSRSDLFSTGVILYRMVTGRLPFQGSNTASMISSILRDPPPPMTRPEEDLPPAFQEIVMRCLEKYRERRIQTAAELRSLLEQLRADLQLPAESRPSFPQGSRPVTKPPDTSLVTILTLPSHPTPEPPALAPPTRPAVRRGRILLVAVLGTVLLAGAGALWRSGWRPAELIINATKSTPSIAVLPLRNLSGGAEHDYFSEGTTEALIANLAKVGDLRVISRSAVMRYQESGKLLQEIADELAVDHVLEGSVMRQQDQLMIIVRLVDPETEGTLWGETYRGSLEDIFSFQMNVAENVAQRTKGRLTSADRERLAQVQEVAPEVYEVYLQGRFHLNKWNRESMVTALSYFKQALAKDPQYALAWAALARCYINLSSFGMASMSPLEAIPKAEQAAKRALELDETLSEAHLALADVSTQQWDWETAEREFERAIELNPGNGDAFFVYGRYLTASGRHQEAIEAQKKAQESDPLSLNYYQVLAMTYYFAGQFDDALRTAERTLEIQDYWGIHLLKGNIYSLQGDHLRADEELGKSLALDPGNPFLLGARGRNYAVWGSSAEARKILSELSAQRGDGYVAPSLFAMVHFALGENNEGFRWLDRAFQERDQSLLYLRVDPVYSEVRTDPRFEEVLRRTGLAKL